MNNVSQPKLESGGSTQPQTDLGKAILEGALNDESKDTAVELAEVGLDTLISEGVLKEVPILKTILAAHKTWTAIHDQLFLRKVASFIQASPNFTEQDRVSFTSEHLSDPKKAKRLGDAVVLILDKLDDLADEFEEYVSRSELVSTILEDVLEDDDRVEEIFPEDEE